MSNIDFGMGWRPACVLKFKSPKAHYRTRFMKAGSVSFITVSCFSVETNLEPVA